MSRPGWASLHNETAILLSTQVYIPLDTVSDACCPSDAGSEYVPSHDTYLCRLAAEAAEAAAAG